MNNRIRAVSIVALVMSISAIGSDDAMAREKRQTGASTRAPLNFSLRKQGSVRPTSTSPIAFKEAWAEFSTRAKALSGRASRSTGTSRSSSFTQGEPQTMQCEFAKLPADVGVRPQRQGLRAPARHSSFVAPQTDPRCR